MILSLLSSAYATEHLEEHAETEVIAGVRLIGAILDEEGHAEPFAGGGLAIESTLGHGLAVEATSAALFGSEGTELPFEIVGERTWHVGHALEPYVGLGPSLVLALPHEVHTPTAGVGGVAVVGAHVWFGDVGLQLEVDATATHRHSWIFGGELLSGVGWRW